MRATDWRRGTKSDHLRREISPSQKATITKRRANILGPKAAWLPFMRRCKWEVRWSARCHQRRGVKHSQLTQVRLFRHPLQIASSLGPASLRRLQRESSGSQPSSRLKLRRQAAAAAAHTQEKRVCCFAELLLLWMFTKQRRRLFTRGHRVLLARRS